MLNGNSLGLRIQQLNIQFGIGLVGREKVADYVAGAGVDSN